MKNYFVVINFCNNKCFVIWMMVCSFVNDMVNFNVSVEYFRLKFCMGIFDVIFVIVNMCYCVCFYNREVLIIKCV